MQVHFHNILYLLKVKLGLYTKILYFKFWTIKTLIYLCKINQMKKTDYYKCNPIDFYNIVLEFDRIDYFMNVLELLFDLAAIGVQYESFFI